MSYSIHNNQSAHHTSSLLSKAPARHESYRETMAQRRDATIAIVTDEGDMVTISSLREQAGTLAAHSWQTPFREGMNFTSTSLTTDAFAFTVKGDLNEEELTDIANLLDDLSAIASNFFSGNMDEAINGAMNIGDLGSLAQLSASFSHSSAWSAATRLTNHHPLPENQAEFSDLVGGMSEMVRENLSREAEYAELLKAQWEQIKEFLDERQESYRNTTRLADDAEAMTRLEEQATLRNRQPVVEDEEVPAMTREQHAENLRHNRPEADTDSPSGLNTARALMEKIQQTVTDHPRLSPFTIPLAHRAIDRETETRQHPVLSDQKNRLKEEFLREYNDWMMSA